jgi:hypothetical protein
MRPLFDDLDEFDFDDYPAVARLMREQRLAESMFSSRRSAGPKHKRQFDEDDDFDDIDDDYDDYDDDFDDDFDDYDDRGYDS